MPDDPAAPGAGTRLRPLPRYAACYCEENVWHLCHHPAPAEGARHVVFVSNASRACPLWAQRAAPAPGQPVVWDYHVLLVAGGRVWDLDSVLDFPAPLADYLAATFRPSPPGFAPRFRVVAAADYLRRFASDRSHMRGPDGGWLAAPPPWPPIGAPGEPSNVMRFVDVEAPFVGDLTDLAGLARMVSTPS